MLEESSGVKPPLQQTWVFYTVRTITRSLEHFLYLSYCEYLQLDLIPSQQVFQKELFGWSSYQTLYFREDD